MTKVGPVCRRSPRLHPEPQAAVEVDEKHTPLLVPAPACAELPPLLVPPPLPLPPPREIEPPLPPPLLLQLPLPPSPARYFLAGECECTHAFPKLQPSGFDHDQHGPRDPAAPAGAARFTPPTFNPLTATLGACWRPPVVMYPLGLVQAGTTTSGKSVGGDRDAFRAATAAPNRSAAQLLTSSLTRSRMMFLLADMRSLLRCFRQWTRSVPAPSWNARAKVCIRSAPVSDSTLVPMIVSKDWTITSICSRRNMSPAADMSSPSAM